MKQRSGMPYDVVAFSTDERATLWTLEEEGAFHRLLRHAWINGGIPGNDLASLAQICRCDLATFEKVWIRLEASWPIDGRTGRRTNRKQEAERRYLRTKADAGSKGGSKAQAKRKQSTEVCLESATKQNSSPLPSPSYKETYPLDFSTFWDAYPEKTGKRAAFAVWKQIKPSPDLLTKMLVTLSWQKKSVDWTKEGGKYIPDPERWLKKGRWDDEPIAAGNGQAYRPKGVAL